MKLKRISMTILSDILTDNEMKATRGGYGCVSCSCKGSTGETTCDDFTYYYATVSDCIAVCLSYEGCEAEYAIISSC